MASKNVTRWVRITAEVVVGVVDEAQLESDAMLRIGVSGFAGAPGDAAPERANALARQAVVGDPVVAVDALVEPERVIRSGAVEHVDSQYRVQEVQGQVTSQWPDFARLFRLCGCGDAGCGDCGSNAVTPRTAAALWVAARVLSDRAYHDVLVHGDDPVDEFGTWSLFDELPRFTWWQGALWRRQFARAFDDLAGDLAAGRRPQPTCPAEEVAWSLALRRTMSTVAEADWCDTEGRFAVLPRQANDLGRASWRSRAGSGDAVPSAWFTTFPGVCPRDPRRPFRC